MTKGEIYNIVRLFFFFFFLKIVLDVFTFEKKFPKLNMLHKMIY